MAGLGADIFLDLKFHDIPNTIAKAVSAAALLPNVRLMTLHTASGLAGMRAAREAVGDKKDRPALLGVTVLTSFDAAMLRQIGMAGSLQARTVSLARLAKKAGLDGVVCSAHEARAIRRTMDSKFLILIPGVRPSASAANDQSRVATPRQAAEAGADYLVIGRPITAAPNPREAALAIANEIGSIL
jgi:orotidine-5'-phosphate decarboxylase